MREAAGPLGPLIIPRLSYGKACGECCEMSNDQAAYIQKVVLKFVEDCKRGRQSQAVGMYGEKSKVE